MTKMFCARCGFPLKPVETGGWQACCYGGGYWTNLKPLESDASFTGNNYFLYYRRIQGLPTRSPKNGNNT